RIGSQSKAQLLHTLSRSIETALPNCHRTIPVGWYSPDDDAERAATPRPRPTEVRRQQPKTANSRRYCCEAQSAQHQHKRSTGIASADIAAWQTRLAL